MDNPRTLTPHEVIDGVRSARVTEQQAAARQLELAVQWALLHPCPAHEMPAHWGEPQLHGEEIKTIAGPGAPLVAEFAPADFGAALGLSWDQAKALIGDALELSHRLPRLWDLVLDGRVPAWRARQVAQETIDLSVEAALFADRLIAATPDKVCQVDIARLVQEARLFFDPDRAVDDEEQASARRGVWLRRDKGPATSDLSMTLDTPDAELLDATIGRIAQILAELGDADALDIRRARAAGVLADPQFALDLMSGREATGPSTAGASSGVHVFVHLTPAEIIAGHRGETGVAFIERLGTATTQLLNEWLARFAQTGANITVRPVLDLNAVAAVDRHDPPVAMRESVILQDSTCVFPACRRDSRFCDLDHITEYLPMADGGPPDQTRPGNLAPLCRTHHRVKTHSAWTYQRLDDRSYTWTSPTGHQYAVLPTPRRAPVRP